jgi:hypothetical protein
MAGTGDECSVQVIVVATRVKSITEEPNQQYYDGEQCAIPKHKPHPN